MKPTGQCNWEMSGVPVHGLSSLSKFRSQFCCFLQEKPSRGRHFRQFFEIYPWQVAIWEKAHIGQRRLGSEGAPYGGRTRPFIRMSYALWTCFDSSEQSWGVSFEVLKAKPQVIPEVSEALKFFFWQPVDERLKLQPLLSLHMELFFKTVFQIF